SGCSIPIAKIHAGRNGKGCRVDLRIVLFEDCSAFTRVAACTLALSPIRDTLIEGFSHFVASMTAPIASGWSESPGGTYTHWKAPPCHGAPPRRSFRAAYDLAPRFCLTTVRQFALARASAAPLARLRSFANVLRPNHVSMLA